MGTEGLVHVLLDNKVESLKKNKELSIVHAELCDSEIAFETQKVRFEA